MSDDTVGKTVFDQMVSSLPKTHNVTSVTSSPKYLERYRRFREICRLAQTNVTLNNALEQVEMLYVLGKK